LFAYSSPSNFTQRFSVTDFKGSIVLLFIISCTTLEFVESIRVPVPLTLAIDLPIQSSMVVSFRVMVTFFLEESQLIVPPFKIAVETIYTEKIKETLVARR
jgi:hypothetical protein